MATSDEQDRQLIAGTHHPDPRIRESDDWPELRIEIPLLGLAAICLLGLALRRGLLARLGARKWATAGKLGGRTART